MPFDYEYYQKCKGRIANSIRNKEKMPYEYMHIYKACIRKDDFEMAKAISEILLPLNYDVADTHAHIKEIQATRI